MDELLVGLVMVDQISGGKGMRALYERTGDEPKRPVRRQLATLLRHLAARLSPTLPEPVGEARVATEQAPA